MKEQQTRIPFSDYPVKEQEKDVAKYERLQEKDVYVMRVDGVWGAFLPRKVCSVSITGKRGQDLTPFINDVKSCLEDFNIKPRFHCIYNKGIEDYLRQQIIAQRLLSEEGR